MSIQTIIDAIVALVRGPMSPAALADTLDKKAAAAPEHLDWRNSIVDLMKLTGQDSSFSHRVELARELGYTGAIDGSADMNNFLHAHVMAELAKR